MILLSLKIIRGITKTVTSNASPFQVFWGTLFGALLGFWPVMPIGHGPSPFAFVVLFLAIFTTCHFGSVVSWFFICWAFSKLFAMAGLAVIIGSMADSLAQWSAEHYWFHASLWSHTGYLGLILLGCLLAPLLAIGMARFIVYARTVLVPRFVAKRKLMLTGKLAINPVSMWTMKIMGFFFAIPL